MNDSIELLECIMFNGKAGEDEQMKQIMEYIIQKVKDSMRRPLGRQTLPWEPPKYVDYTTTKHN